MIALGTLIKEGKFIAVCTALSIVQSFIMCPRCDGFQEYSLVSSFNLALYIFLWRGNAFIAEYLSKRISWVNEPGRRFSIGVLTTVGYTLAAGLLVIIVFERFFGINFGSSYRTTIIIIMVGTFVISTFVHGKQFLSSWRNAALDAERYQRQSISARYESLKTQINPDFLFQSLVDLDKLIFMDEEKAVTFIKKLSDVYRYILDTRDREVVPLGEERKFLTNYFFLLEVRYGSRLAAKLDLRSEGLLIPPLAIQMIVESWLLNRDDDDSRVNHLNIYEEDKHVVLIHDGAFRDDQGKRKYEEVISKIVDRCRFLSEDGLQYAEAGGRIRIAFPRMTQEEELV